MKFTLVIISHNVFVLEFSEDLSSILVICLKGGVTAFSGRPTCLCYNNKFVLLTRIWILVSLAYYLEN